VPVDVDQPREDHDDRQRQQTSFQMTHLKLRP
jgi:hypothetical protein